MAGRTTFATGIALSSLAGALAPAMAGADVADVASALTTAGDESARVTLLFWIMTIAGGVVWLAVVTLALVAARRAPRPTSARTATVFILGGGVVVPVLVLAALLWHGVSMMPTLRAPPTADGARIRVSGEQFWWRVRYVREDGEVVELANEIHLPLGERSELLLDSPDVIHSLWIPAIAGKMDLIPGRTTRLVLEPRRAGRFRGLCAEFCGASHALMKLAVVVEPQGEFEAWLDHQSADARPAADADAFLRHGCDACHAIRGVAGHGAVGPDLTHVGSRLELAAGVLPNDEAGFARWLAETHAIKPEAVMPSFHMLPDTERAALARYLESLQ